MQAVLFDAGDHITLQQLIQCRRIDLERHVRNVLEAPQHRAILSYQRLLDRALPLIDQCALRRSHRRRPLRFGLDQGCRKPRGRHPHDHARPPGRLQACLDTLLIGRGNARRGRRDSCGNCPDHHREQQKNRLQQAELRHFHWAGLHVGWDPGRVRRAAVTGA